MAGAGCPSSSGQGGSHGASIRRHHQGLVRGSSGVDPGNSYLVVRTAEKLPARLPAVNLHQPLRVKDLGCHCGEVPWFLGARFRATSGQPPDTLADVTFPHLCDVGQHRPRTPILAGSAALQGHMNQGMRPLRYAATPIRDRLSPAIHNHASDRKARLRFRGASDLRQPLGARAQEPIPADHFDAGTASQSRARSESTCSAH